MLTRRRFLVLVGGAAPVAAGLALGVRLLPGESGGGELPSIRWGEATCAHCRMIISDSRFAAAWIEPGGREQHFDDIGCLVSALRSHEPPHHTRYFVRDFEADAWLDATTAHYAQSDGFHTPMASGLAAFNRREAAHEHSHDGHAQAWDELVAHFEGGH